MHKGEKTVTFSYWQMLFALSHPLSNKRFSSPWHPWFVALQTHSPPFATFYFSHPLVAGNSVRQVPMMLHVEKSFIHLVLSPFQSLVLSGG